MSTLFEIPLKTLSGEDSNLAPYAGHVLLIVNTASKCGLTPQYEGLEQLYSTYKDRGFDVLGFPANDFAGQEPGTAQEIQKFCTLSYNVTFPMFDKTVVTGAEKSPLYTQLIAAQPVARVADPKFKDNLRGYGLTVNEEPELTWNFEKFLVNRKGEVVARFAPDTLPTDDAVIQAIERELTAQA
ncbi:glutathione peroxidase [Granulicella tundricola]|uniref:Glutathione peroxidase n=1 Tax=Granulicella tundricola (strain ATCC BAA-1859 / DSM 23138 / MP5ACTX9) TaxID=1198114 RepID=E8X2B7_GRATM|nr:glutathione peroxidase [Granulicella tundricola]ADW68049.1 Peroxiredoxin [Granulicella tundricola MP5ACTX9]